MMTKNILLTHQHVIVGRWRYGWIMYNKNDRFIGRSLQYYGEWGQAELNFLQLILTPGSVVIDVGANIGTHTIPLAQQVKYVYAFEPQRLSYQMLCGNIALNGLSNVYAFQQGLADTVKEVKVPVIPADDIRNRGSLNIEGHTEGEPVLLMTLDDLELTQCHLIKIDVEGMEASVLRGGRQTLQRLRPFLFVENNTMSEETGEVISLLLDMKYDCWWHIATYYQANNYFGEQEDIFETFKPEANIFCTPKEDKLRIPGLIPVQGKEDNWQKALRRHTEQQLS